MLHINILIVMSRKFKYSPKNVTTVRMMMFPVLRKHFEHFHTSKGHRQDLRFKILLQWDG